MDPRLLLGEVSRSCYTSCASSVDGKPPALRGEILEIEVSVDRLGEAKGSLVVSGSLDFTHFQTIFHHVLIYFVNIS